MALRLIQVENEHLKLLNNEKRRELNNLAQLKSDHSKLEDKLKDQKQQCNINTLIVTSISILSSFGTKEDLKSIHLSKEAGPRILLFE